MGGLTTGTASGAVQRIAEILQGAARQGIRISADSVRDLTYGIAMSTSAGAAGAAVYVPRVLRGLVAGQQGAIGAVAGPFGELPMMAALMGGASAGGGPLGMVRAMQHMTPQQLMRNINRFGPTAAALAYVNMGIPADVAEELARGGYEQMPPETRKSVEAYLKSAIAPGEAEKGLYEEMLEAPKEQALAEFAKLRTLTPEAASRLMAGQLHQIIKKLEEGIEKNDSNAKEAIELLRGVLEGRGSMTQQEARMKAAATRQQTREAVQWLSDPQHPIYLGPKL